MRTLIIGLGNIGMLYDLNHANKDLTLTHAKAVSRNKNFELVGAVEKDNYKQKLFEDFYKRKAFNRIDKAINDTSPDFIIVSTSTGTHLQVIKEICKNNAPKIILCEKPLSLNLREATEIIEICDKSSTKLFVNYMRRCDPGAKEIYKRIKNKQIELPIKGVCWYTKGLYNNCSHFINLLEMWLGNLIEKNTIINLEKRNDFDLNLDFCCKFKNGEIYFQSAWEDKFTHNEIEIISPNGKLSYQQGGRLITWQKIINDADFNSHRIISESKEIIYSDMNHYQDNVLKMIYDSFYGQANTICTGLQALETLRSINKIYSNQIS